MVEEEKQTSDPWLLKDFGGGVQAKFEDEFKPFQQLPDSETYLASLEAKLKKIKGGQKNEASKDVLKSIQQIKDDLMMNLINSSITTECEVSEDVSHSRIYSSLERNLFPERQALTREELIRLLDADVLSKMNKEPE